MEPDEANSSAILESNEVFSDSDNDDFQSKHVNLDHYHTFEDVRSAIRQQGN
ncbi:hypothetical protein DPMN_183072 [Dreissena polymorpha]|uniref:Uncharacterized protein n=1 Tax=Dreissena polymorpha TaxID=45954 RepID=A0A9D4DGJ7_DREPO|nr:hypothetical protein DPMN_183072 [Dreissena polymorpha]